MHHNIQHALDESLSRFTQVRVPRFLFKQCARNVLCDITRPSLGSVKSHHSYWIGVLAAADIVEDCLLVRCRFIGFDIGAAKLAKVTDHDVHSDIVRLLVWSQGWSWGTHDYSGQTVMVVYRTSVVF